MEGSLGNSKATVSQGGKKGSMGNLLRVHAHSCLRKKIKNTAVPSMFSKVYYLSTLSLRSWLKEAYAHPKAIKHRFKGESHNASG